jgi:outer membrane protein TolC
MRPFVTSGVVVNASSACHFLTRLIAVGALLAWFASGAIAQEGAETHDLPAELVAAHAFHAADPQLGELIAALLESNPEAGSARAARQSRQTRVLQQRSLPDPSLTYRYFAESPETRVGPQQQSLEISQKVPWFGKRATQARRAEHAAAGSAWRARDLERELVAALKRSYFEAAYLQRALAVNSEESELLRRFERIALTRYSTGQGIQQSVIKVQTDVSRLADRETALRAQLKIVIRRIAQLLGEPDADLRLRPIPLPLVDLELDAALLAREARRDHPSVRAAREWVRADEAWLRRKELDARPDFRFGVSYVDVGDREDAAGVLNPPEDNGQDTWALMVGIDLPLFRKRIRSGAEEARHGMLARERTLESTRDRLQYSVQESILHLESIDERARLYRDVVVPQAEEALASAEAAYTTNRQSLLDLLDAERVLFQARLTYSRLLADQWIALADLEYALGRGFPASRSEP